MAFRYREIIGSVGYVVPAALGQILRQFFDFVAEIRSAVICEPPSDLTVEKTVFNSFVERRSAGGYLTSGRLAQEE